MLSLISKQSNASKNIIFATPLFYKCNTEKKEVKHNNFRNFGINAFPKFFPANVFFLL